MSSPTLHSAPLRNTFQSIQTLNKKYRWQFNNKTDWWHLKELWPDPLETAKGRWRRLRTTKHYFHLLTTESCSGARLWHQLCSSPEMRMGDAWNFFFFFLINTFFVAWLCVVKGSVWSQYYQPWRSFGGQNLTVDLSPEVCSPELFLHQKSFDEDMSGYSVFLHGFPIYFQYSSHQRFSDVMTLCGRKHGV